MSKSAYKWLQISLFGVLAIAFSTPAIAGININLRNHISVARQVDQLIEQSLKENGQTVTQTASDEDFLRRITLDLAGRIPSVAEMTLFGLDPDPLKKDKLVQKLIASDDFSANWAAYWRDVIFSRATEERAKSFQGVFESWLKEELAANRSWDKIATKLITATGDVREEGATGLIFAQQGDPKEIAAEVSRIFLGIQIQCANCHDHPTDAWQREQFHEMAAFFPRVRVRPLRGDGVRSFEVVAFDQAGRKSRDMANNPEKLIELFDKNKDGKISRDEVKGKERFAKVFNRMVSVGDQDGDKALSLKELKELPKPGGNRRNSNTEYYMSDLQDPTSKGTLIQPVFFVNKAKPEEGLKDADRRAKLAEFVTDTENPWFAKAYVNRIWSEMLGRGFYAPVDDMGPYRDADHEQAITLLSDAFVANKYDTQWLFRTIASTDAYQRKISGQVSEEEIDYPIAFSCATPTRLRSEQIFASIMELAGIEDDKKNTTPTRPGRRNDPKSQFTRLFGYDPSTPQDDITGTIPQSLFMMNSGIIEQLISAKGNGPLARITRKFSKDKDAISELYLLVFSREPSQKEIKICTEYLAKTENRSEAFEDIMWGLVNSSEFISKR